MSAIAKIRRKWTKLRLQPIRVVCFHQVSDEYNPLTMWECDWTQTELFKRNILNLKRQGVIFLSLSEAYDKLRHDWYRRKKYVALTADDGYKSILNILPWLEEQKIPITLFINTKYLDGKVSSFVHPPTIVVICVLLLPQNFDAEIVINPVTELGRCANYVVRKISLTVSQLVF